MTVKYTLLLATSLALSSAILAAESTAPEGAKAEGAKEPWTFNLYFENDLFSETDQQYTNGIRASWVSPNLEKTFFNDPSLPEWVRKYNSALKFFHELNPNNSADYSLERNLVISFGQTMYTVSEQYIDETALVLDDRPYAGYLFLGTAYHTKDDEQLDTIEVNLGIVGPSALGQEAQDFVHKVRGFEKFKGWDNQLRDEPTLQIVYEHKHRVAERFLMDGKFQQDIIWHAGFSLGNLATYLNAGAEYRIGLQLPKDFGTASLRTGGDSSAPMSGGIRRTQNGFGGWHLFASFDGRAVAHDIFLDGNTFKESHSVDRRPLVGDMSVGFSFTYNRWKYSLAKVFRTREFEGQERSHSFGSLSISYSWE